MNEQKPLNIFNAPFRALKLILRILLCLIFVVAIAIIGINAFVFATTHENISTTRISSQNVDAIVVPGAAVTPDGQPSTILRDRLNMAVQLYNAGVAPVILVSGATTTDGYCEAQSMANYLSSCGVAQDSIVCDFAGFSTYDTMYRAKNNFGYESVVISSQAYHLPRCVFCAQGVGMSAQGVDSTQGHTYNDQLYYNVREVFSNVKNAWEILTHAPANDTSFTQQLADTFDAQNAR